MKNFFEILKNDRRLKAFITENKDMLIKVAAASIFVVVAFFLFLSNDNGNEVIPEDEIVVESADEERVEEFIYVDIGGEVANPMVAKLSKGSRVEDAIDAAGGITENADLTDINRAAFIEDGEKVFIPTKIPIGESGSEEVGEGQVYSDDRININTADSEQLQQLNGIGPATAEKIIDYREANGRFNAVEDILNVSGIGEKTLEKFKADIKV